MKVKPVRTVAVAATALALILLPAACGGGGDDGVASLDGSSGRSASTTIKQDPQEAALDYAKCMREHGVDLPDPGPGGGITLDVRPADRAKVEQAQKACDSILQNAASPLSEEQQNAMQDATLAFAKCMREHGIDTPDPEFGEGGRVILRGGRASGIDPDDPKFQEAEKACRPIIQKAARKAGLPEPGQGPRHSRGGGS